MYPLLEATELEIDQTWRQAAICAVRVQCFRIQLTGFWPANPERVQAQDWPQREMFHGP